MLRNKSNQLFRLLKCWLGGVRAYQHVPVLYSSNVYSGLIKSSNTSQQSKLFRHKHYRLFHSTSPSYCEVEQPKLFVTERCLHRLNIVLEQDELLCVGVRGGGCSGFEYEFSIVNKSIFKSEEHLLFEDCVLIDRESIELMNGAKVDYEDELIRSGFKIVDNPLAEKGCSCGASFALKLD